MLVFTYRAVSIALLHSDNMQANISISDHCYFLVLVIRISKILFLYCCRNYFFNVLLFIIYLTLLLYSYSCVMYVQITIKVLNSKGVLRCNILASGKF